MRHVLLYLIRSWCSADYSRGSVQSTSGIDISHLICKPQGLAAPLHSAILGRLTAGDQDQEVKDAAISAMATELALLGDVLSSKLPDTLQVALLCCVVSAHWCTSH